MRLLSTWNKVGLFDIQYEEHGRIEAYGHLPNDFSTMAFLIDSAGYYVASWHTRGHGGPWTNKSLDILKNWPTKGDKVLFTIDPKHDLELKHLPATAWHSTCTRSVPNILKYGLVPSAGAKKAAHPARIYLAKSPEEARKIASETYGLADSSILTVDLAGLADTVGRIDPDFYYGGFYVTRNIPPKRIKAVIPASTGDNSGFADIELPDPTVASNVLARAYGPRAKPLP